MTMMLGVGGWEVENREVLRLRHFDEQAEKVAFKGEKQRSN